VRNGSPVRNRGCVLSRCAADATQLWNRTFRIRRSCRCRVVARRAFDAATCACVYGVAGHDCQLSNITIYLPPSQAGVVEYSNSSDSDFQICPKSDPNPNSSDSDSDFGFGQKSDRILVASNSFSDIRFSCRIFKSESEKIRVCVSHWITVKPTMTIQ
jgi:hypothetical protein